MTELLQKSSIEVLPSPILAPMRTHSRNLSLGGQSTPMTHRISGSPKVVTALASAGSLQRKGSLLSELGPDVAVDFRIARHSSGSLSMELFRVPEDKLAQLDKLIERQTSNAEFAAAATGILPSDKIGEPRGDAAERVVVFAHPSSQFGAEPMGAPGTFDYRLFMTEHGHVASYWHDVPLDNGDGTINFVCEIPKDTKAKMEVATGEANNPIKQDIKKGKLREYPYNIHWNYGMLPRTWEDPQHKNEQLGGILGDNDPVDVVEIGSEQLVSGRVYKVKVLGAYAMIDEGELDWKIIAIREDDPMARHLQDIDDVERKMEGVLEEIMVWFRDYKMPDGKPANKFGFDNLPQNKELAEGVIKETHEFYQNLISGHHKNPDSLYLKPN